MTASGATAGGETDSDDFAAEMQRLEAALERIARVAGRPAPPAAPQVASTALDGDAATAAIAGRLESMIARLRAVIDEV